MGKLLLSSKYWSLIESCETAVNVQWNCMNLWRCNLKWVGIPVYISRQNHCRLQNLSPSAQRSSTCGTSTSKKKRSLCCWVSLAAEQANSALQASWCSASRLTEQCSQASSRSASRLIKQPSASKLIQLLPTANRWLIKEQISQK